MESRIPCLILLSVLLAILLSEFLFVRYQPSSPFYFLPTDFWDLFPKNYPISIPVKSVISWEEGVSFRVLGSFPCPRENPRPLLAWDADQARARCQVPRETSRREMSTGRLHPSPSRSVGWDQGWEVASGEEGKKEALSHDRNSHHFSTLLCATDFRGNFLKLQAYIGNIAVQYRRKGLSVNTPNLSWNLLCISKHIHILVFSLPKW